MGTNTRSLFAALPCAMIRSTTYGTVEPEPIPINYSQLAPPHMSGSS